MCSICGGSILDERALRVFNLAKSRGRDYSNIFYRNSSWICNHRAIPTTEVENSEFNQPFGKEYKIVHNGTISNDKELGLPEGMIDSYVLTKVLDCSTIDTLKETLKKIKGSYALAILKPNGHFYLACNYKPLFYSLDKNYFIFSSYKKHLEGFSNIERLAPYSILDTETMESRIIDREVFDRAVVIASGGLDSTAVAAYAKTIHKEIVLLHFQYGCIAQTRELDCIKKIAEYLNCQYKVVPINMEFMNGASALFGDSKDIKKGVTGAEYAYEWVPARNLIMLSLAVGFAEANNYSYIYLGTNLEEGGCLSGDTIVSIKKGSNYKNYTLEQLHRSAKKGFLRGKPTIKSLMPNGEFKYSEIDKIYSTGEKELLRITLENGSHIETSMEHEFFTDKGYVQSDKLAVGDSLYTNGIRYPDMTEEQYAEWKLKLSEAKKGDRNPNKTRANRDKITITTNLRFAKESELADGYTYVGGMSFHPYCPTARSMMKHRLVIEASLNNISYEEWVYKIRANNFSGNEVFLDKELVVHHKDGNTQNNSLANLEVMTNSAHSKKHSEGRGYSRLETLAKLEKIVSIEPVGKKRTYDISVRGTHNYVANGLVGHNSYPDNENQFIMDFNDCLYGAVQNGKRVQIITPVGNLMKHEIVDFGNKYNAPFQYTWSCYKNGELPCGECGPCFMRRTAFRRNGLEDPLEYETPDSDLIEKIKEVKRK